MAKQGNNNMGTGMKAGIGIAALAAAAAGAYYFYGKEGAKHRKQLRGWTVKAKGEVMEKMENLRDISEEAYGKAVDQVMDKYRKVKKIDPAEVAALASELRGYWKRISSTISSTSAKPAKRKTVAARKQTKAAKTA